jgi:hypothetical protein
MTDTDRAILDFEREWWRHAGARDQEVEQRWGITGSQYNQRLIAIAGSQQALEYDHATVRRIRRRLCANRSPMLR